MSKPPEVQHLTENPQPDPTTETRRSALKALLSGAGLVAGAQTLPEQWTRPSISSVVLPAHGQATTFSCVASDSADINVIDETLNYNLGSPQFDAPDGTTVTVEAIIEAIGIEATEANEEYTRVIENGTINEIEGALFFEDALNEFEVEFQIDGGGSCQYEAEQAT